MSVNTSAEITAIVPASKAESLDKLSNHTDIFMVEIRTVVAEKEVPCERSLKGVNSWVLLFPHVVVKVLRESKLLWWCGGWLRWYLRRWLL